MKKQLLSIFLFTLFTSCNNKSLNVEFFSTFTESLPQGTYKSQDGLADTLEVTFSKDIAILDFKGYGFMSFAEIRFMDTLTITNCQQCTDFKNYPCGNKEDCVKCKNTKTYPCRYIGQKSVIFKNGKNELICEFFLPNASERHSILLTPCNRVTGEF